MDIIKRLEHKSFKILVGGLNYPWVNVCQMWFGIPRDGILGQMAVTVCKNL